MLFTFIFFKAANISLSLGGEAAQMPAQINLNIYQSPFFFFFNCVFVFCLCPIKYLVFWAYPVCRVHEITLKKCSEKHFHATTHQIGF